MSRLTNLDFNISDLAVAYRKAKVDLFYSNDGRQLDIANYEASLEENLERLCRWLNNTDFNFVDENFVGDYRIVPKNVQMEGAQQGRRSDGDTHIYSSPEAQWEAIVDSFLVDEQPPAEASFRLMANCSIDMHVVSALWMREVGFELDGLLSPSARGNRLRRDRHGEYNPWALGSFEKYLWPYKRWRDDGFDTLEKALNENKNVYCLTADATGFFHRLSPKFLQIAQEPSEIGEEPSSFWKMLKEQHGYEFDTADQRKLRIHRVFIEALLKWQSTQERSLESRGLEVEVPGLPVGLPASALVANLALLEFDKIILKEVHPLYYGRYVDDIMLVWEDLSETEKIEPLRSVSDVWTWLRSKSEHLQPRQTAEPSSISMDNPRLPRGSASEQESTSSEESENEEATSEDALRFCPPYHRESRIEFSNLKNRLYSMGGSTGRNLLVTLRSAAIERSSEWRMMPELPNTRTEVGALVARAKNVDGDAADSLNSLDGISMSRSNFALTLRDFEAFARDVCHDSWAPQRSEFFQAVKDYVLTPFLVFEMDRYIERVLGLALNCKKPEEFIELVRKYLDASAKVLKGANFSVSGMVSKALDKHQLVKAILPAWSAHLHNTIMRSLYRTGAGLHDPYEKQLEKQLGEQVSEWFSYLNDEKDIDLQKLIIEAPKMLGEHLYPTGGENGSLLVKRSKDAREAFDKLFHRDLAAHAYREHLLPTRLSAARDSLIDSTFHRDTAPYELFEEVDHKKFKDLFSLVNDSIRNKRSKSRENDGAPLNQNDQEPAVKDWPSLTSLWGLVFPTRPFTAAELFDVSNILRLADFEDVKTVSNKLHGGLLVARGYSIAAESLSRIRAKPTEDAENHLHRNYINLSTSDRQLYKFLDGNDGTRSDSLSNNRMTADKIRIAVSMFETPGGFISAALHEKPTLSARRYRSLTALVNQTMRLYPRPHYLVLGELALPPSWFNAISLKLSSVGINLIAGVEYIHASRAENSENAVHNQVWASLRHTTLGHLASCVYKQDKQEAAHGERDNLDRERRLRMEPEFSWTSPPIIRHDNHFFGILICSELTNIKYRADYRGRIDTLFVPQWNQDLNTFQALVESAALDVHAYVVQVNNRKYGDTRIRRPAEENWRRDVVQLKGGNNDYLVVGEMDMGALRAFQTKDRSKGGGYKPLPDGFEIAPTRSRVDQS